MDDLFNALGILSFDRKTRKIETLEGEVLTLRNLIQSDLDFCMKYARITGYSQIKDGALYSHMVKTFGEESKKAEKEQSSAEEGDFEVPEWFDIGKGLRVSKNELNELVPVINLFSHNTRSRDHMILVNKKTKQVFYDTSASIFASNLGLTLNELYRMAPIAKFEYRPDKKNEKDIFFKDNPDSSLVKVNMYQTPYWESVKVENPQIPENFKTFMAHLFPNELCREYVYSWMARTIVHRNECMLTLVGAKGVGKNIFADVMRALVGYDNSTVAAQSILEEKFNSQIFNTKFAYFDEVVATDEKTMSKLKRYANDQIVIEAKGSNPVQVKNYTSFMLSCNTLDTLMVQQDDRRFSIPDITDINLKNVWPVTEISKFHAEYARQDSMDLANLGHWLLENYARLDLAYDVNYLWKGNTFKKVTENNLAIWKEFVERSVLSATEKVVSVFEMRKLFKREFKDDKTFPLRKVKFDSFLFSHIVEGGYKLGKVRKGYLIGENQQHLYIEIDDKLWEDIILPGLENKEDGSDVEIELDL